MANMTGTRSAIICAMLVAWFCFCGEEAGAAGTSTVPQEIQSFFDKQEYQRSLDELAKLDEETAAAPAVRRLKTRALLNVGKPKEALEEYDRLQLALKQDELRLLREVAMGFILVMMRDMREQMRGAAYTALKQIDSDDTVPLFEDGLSDGSGPVRMLAVEGLGRLEAGRKSKKLRVALEDKAALVKARAIKVLGKSGDRSVIPLIDAATKDEITTVRIAAYGALARLGRKEAMDQLMRGMAAPNPEDRAEAIRTIADLGYQDAAAQMKALLTYKQPSVRAAAARGLGHLENKQARASIERLLKDPIPAVRESAATALADLGGQESVPALTQGLQDRAFTVRAAVVAALLQLDQPYRSVAPTVRALVQQNDTAARSSAAFALGKATKVNAEGAVEMLMNIAADPLPGPRIVSIRSLGQIGGPELVPLMKEFLHDQNDAVRATAGGALLRILGDGK